mmetsp:Transcript_5912/g.8285  ORF Transcript_5912/g.8285 Transcript_5912/m.8285 type:complete len:112 (+) Transcript_5912:228-563(+)
MGSQGWRLWGRVSGWCCPAMKLYVSLGLTAYRTASSWGLPCRREGAAREEHITPSSSQDPPSLYPAQGWDPVGPIMAIPSCIYVLWLVGWMPSQDLLACFHLNFDGLIPLP